MRVPSLASALALRLSEKQFQSTVEQIATVYGWRFHHEVDSRKSRPGFPDLVLVHPTVRRVLWVELKTESGRVRPEQRAWINDLEAAGETVHVWRPRHLVDGTIQQELHP